MSSSRSFAAISAIKAMHKQAMTLEAENFELKREKRRLMKLKGERDTKQNERKERLRTKAENASQMLKTASIAFSQISDLRQEVDYLAQKNQKTEELLQHEKLKGALLEEQLESIKSDYVANNQRLNSYQKFLGDFLAPPPPPTALSINQFVVLSSDENNVNSLNPELSAIFSRLENYPKKFQSQSLATKKEILKTFCESHKASMNLSNQILFNERMRLLVAGKEMTKETLHLYQEFFAITNEMKKYSFEE